MTRLASRGPFVASFVTAVCCALAAAVPAEAQSAGLLIGATSASVSMGSPPPIVSGSATTTLSRYSGTIAGAYVSTDRRRPIALDVEGVFVIRGVKLNTIDSASGAGIFAADRLTYLEAPVLARLSVGTTGPVGVHAVVGPAFGFRIGASDTATRTSLSDQVKRFDLGLVVGGGLTIQGFDVQVRYEQGLTNIAQNGGVLGTGTMKNRTVAVVVLVPFR